MPNRIQLQRRKGWTMPTRCRSVARPSQYGNPNVLVKVEGGYQVAYRYEGLEGGRVGIFPTKRDAQRFAVAAYRQWAPHNLTEAQLAALRGLDVACFCALDEPCHGDVLLELANR